MLVKERVIIEEPYEQYDEQPAPSPKKKKAKEPASNTFFKKLGVLTIVGIVSVAAVIWSSSVAYKAGQTLLADKDVLMKLQQENKQINLELARLKSPERIQRIAKHELGMSKAKTIYYQQGRKVPAPTPQSSKQIQTPTENIIGTVAGFFKRIVS